MKITPPISSANLPALARTADQMPRAMTAFAGVRKRGWTSANSLKKRLSLAMAYKTRGAVRMTLLAALKVEMRMVQAMARPAQGPRTAVAAVAAMASLAVAPAGRSAWRYATRAMRYRPVSVSEPRRNARGNALCG